MFKGNPIDLNRNNECIRNAVVRALIKSDTNSNLTLKDIDTDTLQVMKHDFMRPLVIVQIFTSAPTWKALDNENKRRRFISHMVEDVPELANGKLKVRIIPDESFSS